MTGLNIDDNVDIKKLIEIHKTILDAASKQYEKGNDDGMLSLLESASALSELTADLKKLDERAPLKHLDKDVLKTYQDEIQPHLNVLQSYPEVATAAEHYLTEFIEVHNTEVKKSTTTFKDKYTHSKAWNEDEGDPNITDMHL